jgi:hypothetical protein
LEMLDEPYNSAKHRESELQATIEIKRECLEIYRDSKQGLIQKLEMNCHIAYELRPSRLIADLVSDREKILIEIHKCVLCEIAFLHNDILIASCLCPYHP